MAALQLVDQKINARGDKEQDTGPQQRRHQKSAMAEIVHNDMEKAQKDRQLDHIAFVPQPHHHNHDVEKVGVDHVDTLEIIEIDCHKNRPQQAQADDGDAGLVGDGGLISFHWFTSLW